MKRPIVIWPDQILTATNVPIKPEEFGSTELHKLLEDLRDCVWHYKALGIAAPQIGINKSVMLVVKGFETDKPEILEMINPQVLDLSAKKRSGVEGCLSFPGEEVEVLRHDYLRVKYFDRDGTEHILDTVYSEPMLAVEIQHEYDHLNGKTLVDYVGAMRRDVMRRRLKKAKQAQGILWEKIIRESPAYKAEGYE